MYTDNGIFVNISEISASVRGKCATDQAGDLSALGLLTTAEANLDGVIFCEESWRARRRSLLAGDSAEEDGDEEK
jgi:hypothetical protein